MPEDTKTKRAMPFIAVALLWAAAFLLSCKLAVIRTACAGHDDAQRSLVHALLGETCTALSDHFYDVADQYFHKGVKHLRPLAFDDSIFQKLADEISPKAHAHLLGTEVTEMMPWLWMAIQTNPRRLDTYLVAAFWLATDAHRPDLALNVLDQAQRNVPYSHEIQLEKGRLFLRQNRISEAAAALDTGLAFWPGAGNPDSYDMRYDRASLLLYRAVVHELQGEPGKAIAGLREILRMLPERTGIKERIRQLEQGVDTSLLPAARLKQMLEDDDTRQHSATCTHQDEHEHDHDHDHEHEHEHEGH